MRYMKVAMDALPTYRPDGRTPALVQTDITDGITVRDDFQAKLSVRNLASGEWDEAITAGHTLCVQVYPIMVSRYRKDTDSATPFKSWDTWAALALLITNEVAFLATEQPYELAQGNHYRPP